MIARDRDSKFNVTLSLCFDCGNHPFTSLVEPFGASPCSALQTKILSSCMQWDRNRGFYSDTGRSLERSTIPSGIEGCRAGDSILGRLVGLDVSRIVASPS